MSRFIAILLSAASSLAPPAATEHELKTQFTVKGKLVVEMRSPSVFTGPKTLWLVNEKGKRKAIKGFVDLKGQVEILDKRAALSYVRLHGSPETAGAWERPEYEIIGRHLMGDEYLYQDIDAHNALLGVPEGCYGVASSFTLRKAGLTGDAEVTQSSAGLYVIKRCLLSGSKDKVTIREVQETVYRDGTYTCKTIGRKSSSAFSIP